MTDEVAQLTVERLCGHHDVSDFRSEDSSLDEQLQDYWRRFRRGEDVLVYAVFDEGGEVLGYVSIARADVQSKRTREAASYLSIPAFAIARGVKGTGVLRGLMNQAEAAIQVRRRASPEIDFRGILCLPHIHERLWRFLLRLDFRPLEGHPHLLWRPFME